MQAAALKQEGLTFFFLQIAAPSTLPLLRVARISGTFFVAFLAWQGATEVMLVTHSLTHYCVSIDFSDVTLLNEDTYGEDEGNGDENV